MPGDEAKIADRVLRLQAALTMAIQSLNDINYIAGAKSGSKYRQEFDLSAIDYSDEMFVDWAKNIIKIRDIRQRHFPDQDFFAEPAWDMLLDLSIAAIHGKKVAVTSLCIASRVPPTTALRWITVLEDRGFAHRSNDENDARRKFIAITDKGLAAMRALYLDSRAVMINGRL